ncbi:MAG: amidohydrolase [Candidatus Syntrophosphaera sp.]|nr:amidohydrolase [Candidatus Syntrophosphaera sp.]
MSFDLGQLRRELHRIPEPAFAEHETKALLLSQLRQLEGIRVHEFATNPGILVEYSQGEGDYRLFRADMDALPVTENTGCGFASLHEGMMHACGHDVHMTVLLGLIERITATKPERNLLFLFQPAEEGQGGAESVLAEGLIQTFPVGEVFALHVASGLPVNTVSSRAGVFFGIPQEFDVIFKGRSAHAAYPEQGVNALSAGIEFMRLTQSGIAELAASARVICHIGKMSSGTVRNVVPDLCKLEGTQRSLTKEISHKINELILANCALAARSTCAEYEVDFLRSYDPVVNSEGLVEELQRICPELGIRYEDAEIALAGEDFGFFTTLYPGLLFWLGSGCGEPLHSGKFLPDETCIPVGIDVFEQLALR